MSGPVQARRLVAVMHRDAFNSIGAVELEIDGGLLLMFRPNLNEPGVAFKGQRQPALFARHFVRDNLPQRWQSAWQQYQGLARPVDSAAWDIDHVFPYCWAEASGFDYVLLTPVPRRPNRSAGAGIERSASHSPALLSQCIEMSGPYAYITAAGIAKLMNIAPGRGGDGYPGLQQIAPDLDRLQALLAH